MYYFLTFAATLTLAEINLHGQWDQSLEVETWNTTVIEYLIKLNHYHFLYLKVKATSAAVFQVLEGNIGWWFPWDESQSQYSQFRNGGRMPQGITLRPTGIELPQRCCDLSYWDCFIKPMSSKLRFNMHMYVYFISTNNNIICLITLCLVYIIGVIF